MKHTIVALLCVGICSAAVADEKLTLTTFFDKTAFYRGEPVAVWLVAENSGTDTMIISVGGGPTGASFEVADEHGKVLPYVGAVVQRASGAVDESQIVRPASRRVFAETLDNSFRLNGAGTYTVTATARVAKTLRLANGKWKSSYGMEDIRTVRSEPQTITITDINDPAVAILKDCKTGWLGCMHSYFVVRHGDPPRPRVQLADPSILDPYIELVRMQFLERPRDLRQWRGSFMKRFPAFDQPGLLWRTMAESTNRYKLKELDGLLGDARDDAVMARHPALVEMEHRKTRLLEALKEATP
ncbi:MAG TPA: hypothetical protein VEK79_01275 [Thermoanaerobaculia bacterium]|nr:hypothetical protein [Thermoanaerobaculia bacterium]